MFKNSFIIVKMKNFIFPFIFLCFTIGLVVFSNSNILAAKNGLYLWANSIIPSLLPFFIATELLSNTSIISLLGNTLNSFMNHLFNIRGEGAFALIMGIISGYPTGAKIAGTLRLNNICSKEECERLLSFTNNSGPLFIIGTVGISMFGNSTIGLLLFITHLLASLSVGIVFRFWKHSHTSDKKQNKNKTFNSKTNTINIFNLGEILGNAISNSISTILMIGGFVVLFSVIISMLKSSKFLHLLSILILPVLNILHIPDIFSNSLIIGLLEITNGINIISSIHIKNISTSIIATSFLLGFGGLSVMLQVFSIISKTDLSPMPYILGKLLHGIIASIYTYILIYYFPFFNFNL